MIKLTNTEGRSIYFLPDDISIVYSNSYGETCVARHNEDNGWKVSETVERVVEMVEVQKKIGGF